MMQSRVRTGFDEALAHAPNERAARFLKHLPQAQSAAGGGGYEERLNYAEALVNSASCGNCAFVQRGAGGLECRAWPPRLRDAGGEWPAVAADDWCGCWRQA